MFSYRLTYAFNEDEVITTIIQSEATDIAGAIETAFEYIMEQHKAQDALHLVGFSILKVVSKDDAQPQN